MNSTANSIRIENIQHVRLNGKDVTLFKVYKKVGDSYVFQGQEYLSGTIKRESTILRKR